MCGNLFAASLYLSKAAMPNEDNAGDGEEDDDAPSAEVASSAWPRGMRPGLVFAQPPYMHGVSCAVFLQSAVGRSRDGQ